MYGRHHRSLHPPNMLTVNPYPVEPIQAVLGTAIDGNPLPDSVLPARRTRVLQEFPESPSGKSLRKWSFAKWKLGLLFKEIRFGISLNRQVVRACCAPRAGLSCRV